MPDLNEIVEELQNAYNKSISNYTTKHFVEKYLI
jgi:hypothetical protein